MRVVVADDSVLLREGIVRILERAGHVVVGVADNGIELLRIVGATTPDVAIVDIRMPPTNTDEGLAAVREIRRRHGRSIAFLVLSQYLEPAFAQELVMEVGGGSGYLLKEHVADTDLFVDAVRRVAGGQVVIDPDIVARLLRPPARQALDELTQRERAVIGLLAEGRSNQAIGERLQIATKTVETHVNAIFSKLALEPAEDDNRRVLAVLAYLRARPDRGAG
ncbi:MAG: response regulator transcription factor [Chloroflexi bacterium]|nr:response regulator transcription factor [Chloroflexota bacterium]